MLLDAYGRPVNIQPLTKELAPPIAYVRTSIFEPVAGRLTPEYLAGILASAMEGDSQALLTLATDMEEREPHYASVIGTRKLAVSGLDFQVESVSDNADDVKQADAIRELVRTDAFSNLLDDLLDALAKGFSVCEIMWERSSTQWWPGEFKWRDPRWFTFHRDTDQIYLRNQTAAIDPPGDPLAPYKFIVHYPRIRNGLRIYGGLGRLAATSYMCKNYDLRDMMRFLEKFGHPLSLGRYAAGATESDLATLRRAVIGIGVDAAAILPDSMRIEFEQPPNVTGAEKLFLGIADWLDRQVSKAVLGQTMTTDSGSSYSQAKVHDEVRDDIKRSDTKKLCATLNRDLVQAFIDLNFGPRERGQYPRIYVPFKEEFDPKEFSEALANLVPLGLRVEQSVIRDKMGLPDPDPKAKSEDLLSPPSSSTPVIPANSKPTKPALNAANAAQASDFADEIEAHALSDWQQVTPEYSDPIKEALDSSVTYEEFANKLAALADTINPIKLTLALAKATFKARGAGDAS
ncbi:MAG: DUF935 domain-containing protein [Verrucomicrobiota bacterium]|nr:DUF935 domain-containing protein [Verrucomicrobiota bacterium]